MRERIAMLLRVVGLTARHYLTSLRAWLLPSAGAEVESLPCADCVAITMATIMPMMTRQVTMMQHCFLQELFCISIA
jgi:hypothetical protein